MQFSEFKIYLLKTTFLGQPVADYMWCAGIILATLLLKKPVAKLLARMGGALTHRFSNAGQEQASHKDIVKPVEGLLQAVLYYIAINQLSGLLDKLVLHRTSGKNAMSISVGDVVDHVFMLLFIIFFAQVISRIIDLAYTLRYDKAQREKNRSQQQLLPLLKEMGKLLLWILATFWIMGSVFHVNIPALITGLGIGGIAIALAGKETVENLFAAFTILTDKPFQTGEVIKLGEYEGTVERIGFRSSRLRNADGAEYIIPNQKLVGDNLVNLTRRVIKGIKLVVNIKYGPRHEAVETLVEEIKLMLQNTPTVQGPINVAVDGFGENVFQVIVNYTLPWPIPAGQTEADIKRIINLKVYDIVTRHTGAPPTVVPPIAVPPSL